MQVKLWILFPVILVTLREKSIIFTTTGKVSARVLNMPVQNSNSKISALAELATYLPQILIPSTFYGLLGHKGIQYFNHVLEEDLFGKY